MKNWIGSSNIGYRNGWNKFCMSVWKSWFLLEEEIMKGMDMWLVFQKHVTMNRIR